MAKPYTVEKEIGGEKYTFQFNGLSAWLQALDDCYVDGSSNVSAYKLNKYLLENVVVSPKKDIDDFDSSDALNDVTTFARKVAQGSEKGDKPEKK